MQGKNQAYNCFLLLNNQFVFSLQNLYHPFVTLKSQVYVA